MSVLCLLATHAHGAEDVVTFSSGAVRGVVTARVHEHPLRGARCRRRAPPLPAAPWAAAVCTTRRRRRSGARSSAICLRIRARRGCPRSASSWTSLRRGSRRCCNLRPSWCFATHGGNQAGLERRPALRRHFENCSAGELDVCLRGLSVDTLLAAQKGGESDLFADLSHLLEVFHGHP